MVFPRYHQLDAVRELVADARKSGPGQNYLIQHSAGSGKSNSIAWLAHRLASLHGRDDNRVFDTVIVVTDRVALDRQLSGTVSSFEQTAGLVEHIDKGGRHLKEALEAGKQIIITTLQKFPVVLEQVRQLEDEWKKQKSLANASGSDHLNPTRERGIYPDAVDNVTAPVKEAASTFGNSHIEDDIADAMTEKLRMRGAPAPAKPVFYKPEGNRFALILDEAHSSQGGDASKDMKKTLRVTTDEDEEMTPAELAQKDQESRGRM